VDSGRSDENDGLYFKKVDLMIRIVAKQSASLKIFHPVFNKVKGACKALMKFNWCSFLSMQIFVCSSVLIIKNRYRNNMFWEYEIIFRARR